MDFEFSDDQKLLMTSFELLLDRYRMPPQGEHSAVAYSEALQSELRDGGFFDIARQDGFGPLDAALLVEATARCPVSAEVAASTLIAPLLDAPSSPIAFAFGLNKPVRYLRQARTLCLFGPDEVLVGTPSPQDYEPIEGVVAYPLALLSAVPADAVRFTGEKAAAIRRRALIGIAAEAAGLMRGALDLTVQYVKDREQFGKPLGHLQAIQHRLAVSAQRVHASRWLAFRAAFDDDDKGAAMACLYAQEAMRDVIHDCHQFSGAMGLTLEYPLHLWTYRLKFLQGEAGGKAAHAELVADRIWEVSAQVAA